ncbi:helix-turn-helix transcriptional regulator [Myroides pelagicus]|uniref:helix-turn-helix domain-containing protein n=1 Tax=Myroides pelagicus TaxID=270914 RepID=UPI002DBFE7FB|nr:helix-turn-helix transcriptional regulator [Myroides pelagicus]MEC4114959.1 helix-turn-helix transcriptional regulator [Myroides pelagicus]
MYFGLIIKELRNKEGLTLTELAAKLKLDSANLSKIENNKREFDEKRLELLADIFKIDLEYLKTEYYSDRLAKIVVRSNCSLEVFKMAENKMGYFKK